MARGIQDHPARSAPHKLWAALLLVPLILASFVAPAASRTNPCPRDTSGQEAEESSNQGKKASAELGEKCCAELEEFNRRPHPARVRSPRSVATNRAALEALLQTTPSVLADGQQTVAWAARPQLPKPIPILLHKQSFLI